MKRCDVNLIWPAMHEGGYEFSSRKENLDLAAEYGITVGTSHCEPMLRNNCYLEKSKKPLWNFAEHPDMITEYWTESVSKYGSYDVLWTIGIRGIHDGGMRGGKNSAEKIQILENVPFPIKGFDAAITEKVPEIYETVKQQNIRQPLILELPAEMSVKFDAEEMKKFKKPKDFIHKNKSGENTRLSVSDTGIFTDSWDDIFQYNREVIYTNWQNSHKIDSVNGLNGYFPTPRIIFQYYINTLPEPESFTLLRKSGINFIVWHEFMKTRTDTLSLDDLEKSPCLIKIAENSEGSTLFKLISCDTEVFYEKNRKQ